VARPPFNSRVAARPATYKPPETRFAKWRWIALVGAVIGAFGSCLVFLLDRTEKCKETSEVAIDSQHRLRKEIVSRRQAFVDAVRNASDMSALRSFPNQHDALHGYIFEEFADRSLAELEDAQTWEALKMDVANSLSARLNMEFVHQRIQDLALPEGTIGRLRGDAVWQALQAQDVAALLDMDLPSLKERAAIENGWLFEQSQNGVRDDLGLVAACSLGTTLEDIRDDWFYLNRRAIHVVRRESPY